MPHKMSNKIFHIASKTATADLLKNNEPPAVSVMPITIPVPLCQNCGTVERGSCVYQTFSVTAAFSRGCTNAIRCRNTNRTSGPAKNNCHSSAMGKFFAVVSNQTAITCTPACLNSSVAAKLINGHISSTDTAEIASTDEKGCPFRDRRCETPPFLPDRLPERNPAERRSVP